MEAIISVTFMPVVLYLMFARISKTWNEEEKPKEANRYSDKATNSINESCIRII